MAGRDWPSVSHDMATAMKNAVGFFNQHEVPLEAGPVTEVALAMFKSYREPSTDTLIEKAAGAAMELFLLYVDRCYEKKAEEGLLETEDGLLFETDDPRT